MFALLFEKLKTWGDGSLENLPGINRRPFILRYQSSLLVFPPAFTAIRLFIILGIGIHRVFHSLLMGIEENVL